MTKTRREMIRESLSEAKRVAFDAALEAEGLEDEIALLRVWLQEALQEADLDTRILKDGMLALTRAVAAQHRLSPKARKDLANRLSDVLNSISDQLVPPEQW